MDARSHQGRPGEWLDVLWAIVLLQGGMLVVSTLESLVANAVQGFALIAISMLTGTAAVVALLSARGLRRHMRWARRLTLVAQWFLLTIGSIELVATQVLDAGGVDIMPTLTGVVMPLAALVLLRRTKTLFTKQMTEPGQAVVDGAERDAGAEEVA